MKRVNIQPAKVTQTILLLFPILLFSLASISHADDGNTQSISVAEVPVEFTAPIMSIDLDNNLMVVAEKDIFLRSTLEDGKKRWITDFVDQNGQSIPASTFKVRDRVHITGMGKGEMAVTAETIRLLASLGGSKDQSMSTTEKKTTSTSGTPPKLVNGVWSN